MKYMKHGTIPQTYKRIQKTNRKPDIKIHQRC